MLEGITISWEGIVATIALILGIVNFYYQFLRKSNLKVSVTGVGFRSQKNKTTTEGFLTLSNDGQQSITITDISTYITLKNIPAFAIQVVNPDNPIWEPINTTKIEPLIPFRPVHINFDYKLNLHLQNHESQMHFPIEIQSKRQILLKWRCDFEYSSPEKVDAKMWGLKDLTGVTAIIWFTNGSNETNRSVALINRGQLWIENM